MYVLLGVTRGDELVGPTKTALYASSSKDRVETKMEEIQRERDDWVSKNAYWIPEWVKGSTYGRFEIQEVAD